MKTPYAVPFQCVKVLSAHAYYFMYIVNPSKMGRLNKPNQIKPKSQRFNKTFCSLIVWIMIKTCIWSLLQEEGLHEIGSGV